MTLSQLKNLPKIIDRETNIRLIFLENTDGYKGYSVYSTKLVG
jgi:hypothetical protein